MSPELFPTKPAFFIKTLMFISVVLMITATLHIPLVMADPISIEVSPTSAPVGATINVSGTNATAGAEVRIQFYVIFLATTVANETGGYSVDVAVPAVPSDTYPIMAWDVAEGDTEFTMFTVEPRINVDPISGRYESEVTIRGDGFLSFSDITILFDGTDVTPFPMPQTDPLGSFESSFLVPSKPNGTYTVTASDTGPNSASTEFNVDPRIMCVWQGASGAPSSLAMIGGYGFGTSVNVTLYFDSVNVTPYPWYLTDVDGSFEFPFFVPGVSDGIYTITANDTDGNFAALQFVVPSPILMLTPSRTSDSSLVTARGIGFMPYAPILLRLEDVTMTQLIDLVWMSPDLLVDIDGSFEYSFIVPVTEPGIYTVAAYISLGAPTDLKEVASAPLTIVDNSALDIDVNVGAVHFRGEMAEFYVMTAFGGRLVNAKLDAARLYYSEGNASLDLGPNVESVATGLFRISYAIPSNASQGTYTLVVQAYHYATSVEAYGAGSSSFLISPTLTSEKAQIIDISGKIGTVLIPDLGVIKANLTAINARLMDIQGTEATIHSDIGTLKTTTDVINAEVTSIEGNVATISSDLGTVKTHVTTTEFQLETATLIVALVAAVGSMLSFMFIRRMRPPVPAAPSDPSPPADPAEPAEQITSPPETAATETPTAAQQPSPAEVADTTESSATPEADKTTDTSQ